jgi:uncharacterized membrane protein
VCGWPVLSSKGTGNLELERTLIMPWGCLPLLVFLWLLFMLPFFFADILLTSLAKLGFSPEASVQILLGIFFGGMINIPVKEIPRGEPMDFMPFNFLGIDYLFKRTYSRASTIIAVNVGGCVIPCLIALYEWSQLSHIGPYARIACLLATATNIFVCYKFSRPVPNVGIAIPAFIPALTAALSAYLLFPEMAPPIAFIAGVLGSLIGADLLHLKDIGNISTGMASIGGAGTFDGIVLTGLLAALLA